MSKRLEKVIDKWNYAYESEKDGSYLSVENIELLIEQAERVEELESEKETLMMAHDNLHRDLNQIKRMIDKDKHALIKSNINHIEKIKELESAVYGLQETYRKEQDYALKLEEKNKHYREVLEKIARINIDEGTVTVSEVLAVLSARKALEVTK